MKISFHTILFFSAIFLLMNVQCKKDSPANDNTVANNHAYGKVIDAVTNLGVSGAHVFFD